MFRHLDRIDPWLKRVDPAGPHERPQERSTLSRDNKEMHPYQLSQAAWHALSHAVDHLHCLRTVLKDAHVMHMYAPYSLARAALQNASAAVWLLAPDDRAERVRRRLRFAALDIKGGEAVRELLGAPEGRKPAEARTEQLREIARRRGVDPTTAVRRLTYGENVEAAGDTMPGGRVPFVLTWKMCRAIAHGDSWATINVVSQEEIPGAPSGLAHLKITADPKTLFFAVFFAVSMTAAGWRLYDDRSRRIRTQRDVTLSVGTVQTQRTARGSRSPPPRPTARGWSAVRSVASCAGRRQPGHQLPCFGPVLGHGLGSACILAG
ncbi:hypothetical protein [Micromonospora aurantiaca (nom. illeg.)]|uniref:hypothetical protein n=1 Tax=Micromonospora aurantiaca (nom. illeg.) TaxID=47850 RepID=UPI0037AFB6DF